MQSKFYESKNIDYWRKKLSLKYIIDVSNQNRAILHTIVKFDTVRKMQWFFFFYRIFKTFNQPQLLIFSVSFLLQIISWEPEGVNAVLSSTVLTPFWPSNDNDTHGRHRACQGQVRKWKLSCQMTRMIAQKRLQSCGTWYTMAWKNVM